MSSPCHVRPRTPAEEFRGAETWPGTTAAQLGELVSCDSTVNWVEGTVKAGTSPSIFRNRR